MVAKRTLSHVAAGMLASFVGRNNDFCGYWALGFLYQEAAGDGRMILDLLNATSVPPGPDAGQIARTYAAFLLRALSKKQAVLEDLSEARIELQFNAGIALPPCTYSSMGDPFICTVILRANSGRQASFSAVARCKPFAQGLFSQRGAF